MSVAKVYEVSTDELRDIIPSLRIGDRVILSGTVYTARDAAHKEFMSAMDEGRELPFDVKDAAIYYAGPTPGKNGMPVGSCGPTTSSRMDAFAPRLMDAGLAAMIGKGGRNDEVRQSVVRNGGVYLCAVGGAGALIAKSIKAAEIIAYPHLGCEAVRRLTVEKMPLIVAIDSHGGDIFAEGRAKFERKL